MTMSTSRRVILFSLLACVVGGRQPTAAAAAEIRIAEAWARAGISGGNSAIYMRIQNSGPDTDHLLGAATDVAEKVELHETLMQEGVMRMRPAEAIAVPAHGEAMLEPGGWHVMLIGLRRALRAGERLRLQLRFARAGDLELEVPVREAGGMSHGGGMQHGGSGPHHAGAPRGN